MILRHLRLSLAQIDEEIKHMEASDHAHTRAYATLVSTRRSIRRAIRKLERIHGKEAA